MKGLAGAASTGRKIQWRSSNFLSTSFKCTLRSRDSSHDIWFITIPSGEPSASSSVVPWGSGEWTGALGWTASASLWLCNCVCSEESVSQTWESLVHSSALYLLASNNGTEQRCNKLSLPWIQTHFIIARKHVHRMLLSIHWCRGHQRHLRSTNKPPLPTRRPLPKACCFSSTHPQGLILGLALWAFLWYENMMCSLKMRLFSIRGFRVFMCIYKLNRKTFK